MDFGDAIKNVKKEANIQRAGWNGKGMHVFLFQALGAEGEPDSSFPPVLGLFNAQGKKQLGWAPSQADMMAEDWIVLV